MAQPRMAVTYKWLRRDKRPGDVVWLARFCPKRQSGSAKLKMTLPADSATYCLPSTAYDIGDAA
jgi:hypothetical protein